MQRRAKSLLKITMLGQYLPTHTRCPWWWRSMITRWCDVMWCDYWHSYVQYFPAPAMLFYSILVPTLRHASSLLKRNFYWFTYITHNDFRPMLTMSSTSSLATMSRWGRRSICLFLLTTSLHLNLMRASWLIDSPHHLVWQVLEAGDGGWWKGRCKGRTGLFPVNYVQALT